MKFVYRQRNLLAASIKIVQCIFLLDKIFVKVVKCKRQSFFKRDVAGVVLLSPNNTCCKLHLTFNAPRPEHNYFGHITLRKMGHQAGR